MACRLTKTDRRVILNMRKEKASWRAIGKVLGKSHTSLSREYSRNKSRGGVYDPDKAHQKAKVRMYGKRKTSNKIRGNNDLNSYVLDHLEVGWSAEVIAGRRNNIDRVLYKTDITTCGLSIRRYIDSRYGSYIKFHMQSMKMLKRYKKRAQHGKRQGGSLKHRVFIDQRPEIIGEKVEFGHYEVDFIVSAVGDLSVILVLIEKVTRMRTGIKLPDRKSETVRDALLHQIAIKHIKSLTFDNDTGFALHHKLGVPTYFCHTHSSREKGQVERGNTGYRKFWPKKTQFENVSQDDIDIAVSRMNNYPLECLGYHTPQEMYDKLNGSYENKLARIVQGNVGARKVTELERPTNRQRR